MPRTSDSSEKHNMGRTARAAGLVSGGGGAPRDDEAMRYQTNSLSGTAERERLAASGRAPANRPHGSGNGRAGVSWGVRE